MTVDPNDPNATIETPPPPPPAAPEVDVEKLADAMVEKLTAKAEARPAPTPPPERPTADEESRYKELQQRAADPNHPLHIEAVEALNARQRAAIEDEWQALGCDISHPARALFRANSAIYFGAPRFAFQAWQLQELRDKQAAAEQAKPKEDEDEEPAAKPAKPKAPGMPPRSVGTGTRQSVGKLKISMADFLAKSVAERDEIEKKADRGEVEWLT